MKTCPGAAASPFGFLARLVTAGVLSGASVAGMAATASFVTTLPTTDVIRQTTALSSGGNLQLRHLMSGADNNRWVGVGFTAPNFSTTLDRITLYINFSAEGAGQVAASVMGAAVKIDVVELSSLTAAPSAPYAPIYSEMATMPASYGQQSYLTFDLTTPFALEAGQNYGIMLSFPEAGSSRGINFRTAPTNSAGLNGIGSTFYTTNGGTTYTVSTNPLAFVLQTTPPSNIPEPSSAALLLGGAGLGAVTLRRRGRSGRL